MPPPVRCCGPRARRPWSAPAAGPADHDQLVRGLCDLADQMAGDEHGAAMGSQVFQQAADPADALRVQAVDRLV